jgi:hypothetical protein
VRRLQVHGDGRIAVSRAQHVHAAGHGALRIGCFRSH